MATTSLSLGRHWEEFIRGEVESGRYGSASEVVRDALRALEERKQRIDALRGHLAQGAEESARGDSAMGTMLGPSAAAGLVAVIEAEKAGGLGQRGADLFKPPRRSAGRAGASAACE